MAQGLKAVSDASRIRILEILCDGERCVSELVDRLGLDQPKVSHHLAILRSAGILRARRDGRHINYSMRPTVHRRSETADGPVDIVELDGLVVSFRFGSAAAPQPVRERSRSAALTGAGAGPGPNQAIANRAPLIHEAAH